jgi:HSP20 family molecular chaperone IbpA
MSLIPWERLRELEDVKVTVHDGVLRIQGERRQETEDTPKKHQRIERSYGMFLHTFALLTSLTRAGARRRYTRLRRLEQLPEGVSPSER